ncbi:motility twitching protein PilT [Methanothrix harundinacea]|uniref:PilT protein domain protein n=1 Tax=Methanothrix harundinacea (strain 6Ac) TaxID=1110509 RepID=G7WR96_METH6|nr:motility twitching protein PilT [Methanothrix harundinacea]AET65557.1 PilT protein domain protein [Methanothrix harundinacea 6Ac]
MTGPERGARADRKARLPGRGWTALVYFCRGKPRGRRIGDFDEVIASIALVHDREIGTRDLRFREVLGW